MWLLHGWVCIALELTQLLQALRRTPTCRELRLAEILDILSTAVSPKQREWCGHRTLRRQGDTRCVGGCTRALRVTIVTARAANPERLEGSWAGEIGRRCTEGNHSARHQSENALLNERLSLMSKASSAIATAPKVVQGGNDGRAQKSTLASTLIPPSYSTAYRSIRGTSIKRLGLNCPLRQRQWKDVAWTMATRASADMIAGPRIHTPLLSAHAALQGGPEVASSEGSKPRRPSDYFFLRAVWPIRTR